MVIAQPDGHSVLASNQHIQIVFKRFIELPVHSTEIPCFRLERRVFRHRCAPMDVGPAAYIRSGAILAILLHPGQPAHVPMNRFVFAWLNFFDEIPVNSNGRAGHENARTLTTN